VETALIVAIAIFVLLQTISGDIASSAATLAIFLSGGLRLTASLLPLQSAFLTIKQSIPPALRALELLQDSPAPEKEVESLSSEFIEPNHAVSVRLEKVNFSYHASERDMHARRVANMVTHIRDIRRLGAAAMIEFWQSWNNHPTLPDGFTSGTLLVDAAEASGFLRLRHGFSTGWRNTALGPEVSFSAGRERSEAGVIGRDSWLKMRMGLHANGLTFGSFGLNGSAGYEWRRNEPSSAYAEVTVLYHY
jgi:ABC-type multidrug transport system fused ATPase/permease subunit